MNRSIPSAAPARGAPDRSATPAELAVSAVAAVHALNHATTFGGGYTAPADVNVTLGELQRMLERLPQALEQAGQWLENEAVAGRVGHDQAPGDVRYARVAASSLVLALTTAAEYAGDAATSLREARQITSHLVGGER